MLVLLDASFLMHIAKAGMTLDDLEVSTGILEPRVPEAVLNELRTISNSGSKRSKVARLALDYCARLSSYPGSGYADDVLFNASNSKDIAVATLDKELIKRIRKKGGLVITLRGDRAVLVGRDHI